jgi:hypothetical protein
MPTQRQFFSNISCFKVCVCLIGLSLPICPSKNKDKIGGKVEMEQPETQLAASMVEEVELVPSSQTLSATLKTWTLRWPHRGKKVAKVCHHFQEDTQTSASFAISIAP